MTGNFKTLIHAGPSCGKTVALRHLASANVFAMDTDFIAVRARKSLEVHFDQLCPAYNRVVNLFTGSIINIISELTGCSVYTNLYGREFTNHMKCIGVGSKDNRMPLISVFRTDAHSVVQSFIKDGKSPVPVDVVEGWIEGWVRYAYKNNAKFLDTASDSIEDIVDTVHDHLTKGDRMLCIALSEGETEYYLTDVFGGPEYLKNIFGPLDSDYFDSLTVARGVYDWCFDYKKGETLILESTLSPEAIYDIICSPFNTKRNG